MRHQDFDTVAWQRLLESPGATDHIAQVYRDQSFFMEAVVRFVSAGLRQGEGIVLVMRNANWDELAGRLSSQGFDVGRAVERGQISMHDADATLASLMKSGMPDAATFNEKIGGVIRGLRSRYRVVRAFGEMVDILWSGDCRDAATALEGLWNDLARTDPFALLCAYHIDPLDVAAGGHVEGICNTHTHLIPDPDYGRFDDAISKASQDVLDESSVMMVQSLAVMDKPRTAMPFGEAVILWLSQNMPRTAEKVLARVRTRYG